MCEFIMCDCTEEQEKRLQTEEKEWKKEDELEQFKQQQKGKQKQQQGRKQQESIQSLQQKQPRKFAAVSVRSLSTSMTSAPSSCRCFLRNGGSDGWLPIAGGTAFLLAVMALLYKHMDKVRQMLGLQPLKSQNRKFKKCLPTFAPHVIKHKM